MGDRTATGRAVGPDPCRRRRRLGGRRGFVEAFSGTHRFVLDYLVEEVLDRQPDEVRAFLLDTSVLDQLTGGLCDALTGRSDGQPMLETLERENLFVVPLDDERRWYRYHHLSPTHCVPVCQPGMPIASMRCTPLPADGSPRTVYWPTPSGMRSQAVTTNTADFVELAEADLRRRRQDRTLRDWLVALPHDVTRRRPLLATFMGWSRLSEGDIDGVEAWLNAADAARPDAAVNDLHGGRARRGGQRPARSGPPGHDRGLPSLGRPGTRRCRRNALPRSPGTRARRAGGPLPRGAAAGFIGLAAWAGGDLATAVDTFTEAVVALHAAGMVADELGATVAGQHVAGARTPGRGTPALRRARTRREPLRSDVVDHGRPACRPADVLREQGDLDEAAEHWRSPASWATGRRCWRTGTAGTPRTPHCCRRKGDIDGAIAMLDRLTAVLARLLSGRAADRRDQGAAADHSGPPRRRAGLGERARGRTNRSADLPVRVQPTHPRPAARCRG